MMGEGGKFTKSKSTVVNIIYVAFCMLVAMFCPGLSDALSFAGVLVVVIDLIFPGLMLLELKGKTSMRSRIIAYVLIAVGSLIGIISLFATVQNIYKQVTNGQPDHHTNSSMLGVGSAHESFGP